MSQATQEGLRRKQRHRAVCHVGTRLDQVHLGHGASMCFACCVHLSKVRHPQPCDVDRCGIVTVGIVGTVRTHQPASPLHRIASMDLSWGAVCLRRVPTSWAGVRGLAWALRAEANTHQMTFIAEYVPDVGADRGVISPVAPLASHASPPPGRFERLEGFTANEGASPHCSEEQKQVCGQMAEFPVACFIELPTSADFLCVESSPGIILRKPGCCRVQFVDLPARACLVPIEATRVHEQRARHLHRLVGFPRIPAPPYGTTNTMNSPNEPQHAFRRFPLDQPLILYLPLDILASKP